jgi:hypothetical protein
MAVLVGEGRQVTRRVSELENQLATEGSAWQRSQPSPEGTPPADTAPVSPEPQPADTEPTNPEPQPAAPQTAPEVVPLKIGVVDDSKSFRDSAHDKASAELTSTAEQRSQHFVKRIARSVWQGFTRPYMEQRAIQRNLDAMVREHHSRFGGDEEGKLKQEANDDRTVERFLGESFRVYEDAGETKTELGDSQPEREIKQAIKKLVGDYIRGDLNDDNFEEERGRVLQQLTAEHPDLMGQGLHFADNMHEIARAIMEREETQEAQLELLSQTEIILGQAHNTQRTEAKSRETSWWIKAAGQ